MFKGSLVALATPFDSDNRVDFTALKALVDFHVGAGSDGLVVAGTTGEAATMNRDEHTEVVARVVEYADGRLPIIAGTGSNSTRQTINMSLSVAAAADIDAFLVVVPYYNKPMQEGIYQHFMAIADAVPKPVMMYNVPGRTVADMQAETVGRLAPHENIFGIKEATGDIERLKQIQEVVDDDFKLYSGDDFTALQFLEQGGDGIVTVSGNVVPGAIARLCRLVREGRIDEARALDATLQPLNDALFVESNPIPVKWALQEMGLIAPYLRLPMTEYSQQHHEQMRSALATAGVKLGGAT